MFCQEQKKSIVYWASMYGSVGEQGQPGRLVTDEATAALDPMSNQKQGQGPSAWGTVLWKVGLSDRGGVFQHRWFYCVSVCMCLQMRRQQQLATGWANGVPASFWRDYRDGIKFFHWSLCDFCFRFVTKTVLIIHQCCQTVFAQCHSLLCFSACSLQ